jgi:prepilin-type N-terminal cleavage/methylation domain-containing protein
MVKETNKAVSIKVKNQLGFNLLEIIVVLALMAIVASIAVPRFFNFSDKASERILNAVVAELNGREILAFVGVKKSHGGWVNDQIVFSKVNTDMGTGFHWGPKPKKKGGTLHFKNQKIKLERISSTNASAGKWIKSK